MKAFNLLLITLLLSQISSDLPEIITSKDYCGYEEFTPEKPEDCNTRTIFSNDNDEYCCLTEKKGKKFCIAITSSKYNNLIHEYLEDDIDCSSNYINAFLLSLILLLFL